MKVYKELGNELGIARALRGISDVKILKDEPELALTTINDSLVISTRLDRKHDIAICFVIKGIILKLMGQLNLALTHLEEGWNRLTQIRSGEKYSRNSKSLALFHLILLAQDFNALTKAEQYLTHLKQLQQTSQDRYVQLRTRFAEAIVLKMRKGGFIELGQAKEIFQGIIEEDIIQLEISVLAILNMCELLILELKISETQESLLKEINSLSEELYAIAHSQQSSSVGIMSLLLKSKLALIEDNLGEASELLESAQSIAKEKNMKTLLETVRQEQTLMQTELDRLVEGAAIATPLKERIERFRLESYIQKAKKIQESMVGPSPDMLKQG